MKKNEKEKIANEFLNLIEEELELLQLKQNRLNSIRIILKNDLHQLGFFDTLNQESNSDFQDFLNDKLKQSENLAKKRRRISSGKLETWITQIMSNNPRFFLSTELRAIINEHYAPNYYGDSNFRNMLNTVIKKSTVINRIQLEQYSGTKKEYLYFLSEWTLPNSNNDLIYLVKQARKSLDLDKTAVDKILKLRSMSSESIKSYRS